MDDGFPVEQLKADYFDAEMAAYDRLPKLVRDFMKDNGGFATEITDQLRERGKL